MSAVNSPTESANSPAARYEARGVSAGKAEVHAAIANQDQGLFPGAFCKLVPDLLGGDASQCVVMHADDVGTKTALAYLAWMEGLGDRVWAGIAQDSLVMNIDDCGCVGATGPFLLANTISRNARRIPGSVIKGIIDGYQQVCDLLAGEGIDCRMTGGETSDCGDVIRTIFVDSVVAARLARTNVIDAARMAPGDVIIGFSATGQARWEDRPTSGMGSNGLTSARHELLGGGYREKYPETFAPETDPKLMYCGKFSVHDRLPGTNDWSVGEALLSPTRTYLPLIVRLITSVPAFGIHGLIHCTGGGQTKIGKFGAYGRAHGNRYVKDALFPVPPLFAALKEHTGQGWQEMYAVYNMGHRLEAVLPETHVETCLAVAKGCGIEAKIVGRVEDRGAPGNEVVVKSAQGTFTYSKV
jgi:phosphoribosylformylglycinamidine cyclo-ligase